MKVITILEAHVTPEQIDTLKRAYRRETERLDAGLEQTFLMQSTTDSTLWRILTVWESREALARMRQSGQTPRGLLMFREAKAEPMLSIFDVSAHAEKETAK